MQDRVLFADITQRHSGYSVRFFGPDGKTIRLECQVPTEAEAESLVRTEAGDLRVGELEKTEGHAGPVFWIRETTG